MRSSHVVTALVTVTAGLTAAAAWQRRTDRRLPTAVAAPVEAPVPASAVPASPVPASALPVQQSPVETVIESVTDSADLDQDGIVLPFVRRAAAPAAEQPATPARCGDNGGRTKVGAPCAARATTDGRCHHHRVAA